MFDRASVVTGFFAAGALLGVELLITGILVVVDVRAGVLWLGPLARAVGSRPE